MSFPKDTGTGVRGRVLSPTEAIFYAVGRLDGIGEDCRGRKDQERGLAKTFAVVIVLVG